MSRLVLSSRATDAREIMDDPGCDPRALERTYHHFRVVNRVVAGWRSTYRHLLRPAFVRGRENTLLDIGSGGGDVPRLLAAWAARDGFRLRITAIDPDPRAQAYASVQPPVPGLTFRAALSGDLVAEGARFDLVTSNHVLHHLSPAELAALLADSERLAARLVVHSDIERHPLAYAGFSVGTWPFFRDSFIRADGLTSIRRSFTGPELRAVAPAGWTVENRFPFRNLLVHRAPGGPRA
ncbi:class I SAM-dependent methyltransferase [Microbacteriaceae bacterium 4G12]